MQVYFPPLTRVWGNSKEPEAFCGYPSLLFESALEGVEEVSEAECADGAGRDGVPGRGEDGVDEAVVLPAVLAADDLTGRLCGRRNGVVSINRSDHCDV